ncbi:MAG: efflux RND transporter permease subunit, partial [Planctomycetes bacterium]|nr:efflux RND transporter permease subunit [Planctomycetota bacterium]
MMIDRLLRLALGNRAIVLALALALLTIGAVNALRLPVDVFPDINRPTVALMTEAPGLAPEEVETLVTLPLETALNGSTGVERVRSSSAAGLSIVWVEFPWGSDVYRDRQVVAEKVALARERLPAGTNPVLSPISSLMGEIQLVGLSSRTGTTSLLDLRGIADWVVRPRLVSLPGVSQVTVLGGRTKQVHVLADPMKLANYGVTLDDLVRSCRESSASLGGGFSLDGTRERIVRVMGRIESLDDIRGSIVSPRESRAGAGEDNAPLITAPILVRDVASVAYGSPVARGDGSVNASPAIILSIQKQPGTDTLALTRAVDRALSEVESALPPDVVVNPDVFRQADFIETAIGNLGEALRDGAILAAIVLFLFLWNVRTTVISLVAIPASLLLAALVFHLAGIGINTMTLGGLAVAVGELVDDSIVDVENVFRRLRENHARGEPRSVLGVVFDASREIRHSIVHATVVIALVFLPLFSLSGLEGSLFTPLGIAYLVALFASLLVSLTVTPVLCSILLPRSAAIGRREDAFLLRALKAVDRRLVGATLRHPGAILVGATLVVAGAAVLFFRLGSEFLPPFAEGTYTVTMIAGSGTSLEESNRLGMLAEKSLLSIPGVASTSRRTGRAELDEHAEGVNYSEIDVRLDKSASLDREAVARGIRDKLAYVPGVVVNVGQPIAHRIDHILSGTRAQVAIKVVGADLGALRDLAWAVHDSIRDVPGVVDLQVDAPDDVPRV